jgi:ubiquinone/menaquinone biosynthesis C-methylase UbiE
VTKAPRTDYDAIAASYDEDRKHWEIARDDILASRRVKDVLDVGCGTGLWPVAQQTFYEGEPIRWTGLDASEGMLAEARTKASGMRLVNAFAEALPFAADSFDFVYSSFAYHHFTDKDAAFDEVRRVLRTGGTLRIRHIDPESMRDWWVYRYFPHTRALDDLRFWTTAALRQALERRGFGVEIRVRPETTRSPAGEILAEAERRVVSQLAILDDPDYRKGMELLRELPPQRKITTAWAGLTLTATLGGADAFEPLRGP